MNQKKLTRQVDNINKSGLCTYLFSPPGQGKTDFIKNLAKTRNANLVVLNLSSIESIDFTGMPYVENGITSYAKPYFFDCDILFLDEIEKINDISVKSCLLSLIIDKQMHNHKLKDNCLIISAGNSKLSECDMIDALKDRLVEINFNYTVNEKLRYFESKYNGMFINFLKVKPELLGDFSSRRIEAFLKSDDESLIGNFFNKDIERLYNHFVADNLITIDDLCQGRFSVEKIAPLTISMLIVSIVENLARFKSTNECKNIARFVSELSQEHKSIYFTKLKEINAVDTKKFKEIALSLKDRGFFDGQKEFLTELVAS